MEDYKQRLKLACFQNFCSMKTAKKDENTAKYVMPY